MGDKTQQAQPTSGFSDLANFQAMYANQTKFKNQLDDIAAAMQSGGHPEREPQVSSGEKSVELVQEIPTIPELENKPELSGYIDNVEKASELNTSVMDDYTNQVLLGNANPKSVKIKLPLEEPQIEEGMHHKAWEAIRWLAEWCMRQLKIVKAREVINPYDS